MEKQLEAAKETKVLCFAMYFCYFTALLRSNKKICMHVSGYMLLKIRVGS